MPPAISPAHLAHLEPLSFQDDGTAETVPGDGNIAEPVIEIANDLDQATTSLAHPVGNLVMVGLGVMLLLGLVNWSKFKEKLKIFALALVIIGGLGYAIVDFFLGVGEGFR